MDIDLEKNGAASFGAILGSARLHRCSRGGEYGFGSDTAEVAFVVDPGDARGFDNCRRSERSRANGVHV